jgi:L-serine dehydratase
MAISVFDLFKIGIGPSSSHTVGPMRAARLFALQLEAAGKLAGVATVRAELFGSLGATGAGHGSHKAVILGLEGEEPETVDTDAIPARLQRVRETKRLRLLGRHGIPFRESDHLVLHRRKSLPYHPNGMRFTAHAADGQVLHEVATTRSAAASSSTRRRRVPTGSSPTTRRCPTRSAAPTSSCGCAPSMDFQSAA